MNILNNIWSKKITVQKFNDYCEFYNILDFKKRRDILLDLKKCKYSTYCLLLSKDRQEYVLEKLSFLKFVNFCWSQVK